MNTFAKKKAYVYILKRTCICRNVDLGLGSKRLVFCE